MSASPEAQQKFKGVYFFKQPQKWGARKLIDGRIGPPIRGLYMTLEAALEVQQRVSSKDRVGSSTGHVEA